MQDPLLVLGQHSADTDSSTGSLPGLCNLTQFLLPADNHADGAGHWHHSPGALPAL